MPQGKGKSLPKKLVSIDPCIFSPSARIIRTIVVIIEHKLPLVRLKKVVSLRGTRAWRQALVPAQHIIAVIDVGGGQGFIDKHA